MKQARRQLPLSHDATFLAFYRAVNPALHRFLRHAMAPWQREAEDVAHEVWLQVAASYDSDGPQTALREEFVRRVAWNLARQQRRRLSPEVPLDDTHTSAMQPFDIDTMLDMRDALAGLKPDDGKIFWLAEVEDHTHQEVAQQVGVHRLTVGARILHARQFLAKRLARSGYARERSNAGTAVLLVLLGWFARARTATSRGVRVAMAMLPARWSNRATALTVAIAAGLVLATAPLAREPDAASLTAAHTESVRHAVATQASLLADVVTLPEAPPSPPAKASTYREPEPQDRQTQGKRPKHRPTMVEVVSPPPFPAAEVEVAIDCQDLTPIEDAQRHLQQGNAATALSRLKLHAKACPNYMLDEEREILHIRALHMLGRLPEAEARLGLFHHTYPDSIYGSSRDDSPPRAKVIAENAP